MRRDSGMAPLLVGAAVAGYALTPVEALHRVRGDAHIQLSLDQRLRYRVVVVFNGHVVIDMHPGPGSFCVAVRLGWQGA